ncbi:hypothetical protein F0Q53_04605 [Anaplasma marginale]|uniref:Uncharacterized protein n=1 Tax=Anaplasma marginale TaxID=770 RepID=A0A643CKT6_ANAMA|nr:hypothetical protein F0Q53_04605 [Anaplasma marginale]KAB0451919.1 hypothetical protein FY207_02800 [Anaplasma marginale]
MSRGIFCAFGGYFGLDAAAVAPVLYACRPSVILCRVAKCLRVLALTEWSAVRVAREIAFPLYFSCGGGDSIPVLGGTRSPRVVCSMPVVAGCSGSEWPIGVLWCEIS